MRARLGLKNDGWKGSAFAAVDFATGAGDDDAAEEEGKEDACLLDGDQLFESSSTDLFILANMTEEEYE